MYGSAKAVTDSKVAIACIAHNDTIMSDIIAFYRDKVIIKFEHEFKSLSYPGYC